jgi:hypothetical protein
VFFRRSAGRNKTLRNVLRGNLAKLVLFLLFWKPFLEMLIMAMGPILVPIVESVSGALDLDLARLLRPRSGPPGISWHLPDQLSHGENASARPFHFISKN